MIAAAVQAGKYSDPSGARYLVWTPGAAIGEAGCMIGYGVSFEARSRARFEARGTSPLTRDCAAGGRVRTTTCLSATTAGGPTTRACGATLIRGGATGAAYSTTIEPGAANGVRM